MSKLDELKQKHKELGEAIKRLEGNGGRWVPEIGEGYWFVGRELVSGRPSSLDWATFSNVGYDKILMRQGNMYRTQEEAERALEMETYEFERSLHIADVNRVIDEANGDWVADVNNACQGKCALEYLHTNGTVAWDDWGVMERPSELKPFKPEAFEQIKSQLTQEQIDYIWRLNKPEGVK